MRRKLFTCPLLALCGLLTSTAHAAGPVRDVKVCVRIDEKTFTSEKAETATGAKKTASTAGREATTREAGKAEGATPATPTAPATPAAVPSNGSTENGAAAPFQIEAPAATAPPVAPAASATAIATAPAAMTEADEEAAAFLSVDPEIYLRRLIEYHVTHEPGFESVTEGCKETITVELYPVLHGYTVFARYSGNAREEKVDVVRLDEMGAFAERVTTALLRDRTISETLTRTTVLRADSEARVRQIRTRTHFLFGMGSTARFAVLPTAPNSVDPATDAFRIETPLRFTLGARNKFRAWALDATGRLDVGLTERASRRNAGGGHVDYSVGLGFGLGFLAYADPDAVNTLYYGGGGSFEITRYQALAPRSSTDTDPDSSGLWGGGLDVDLTLGYEFMRTSALHFFVQGTVALPAYVFDSENSLSHVHSYIPSANAQVGLLF